MLNIIKKNYQFFIFLLFYFLVGAYLSIINGITSDEFHQQKNWEIHLRAIINFLKYGNYDELLNYGDRYHGIAFHYISQPIQFLFHDFETIKKTEGPRAKMESRMRAGSRNTNKTQGISILCECAEI